MPRAYTRITTGQLNDSSTASQAYASTTLAPGSTATFKATAKTGYEFVGWFTAASGGTAVSTNATYTFKYDISYTGKTLYARFKANQYTITYKDQGGGTFSGTHASGYPTKHTYGTATTLKDPSKAGYTFEGWFTDAACTNKVTSLGATAYTASITLYAKWTAIAETKYEVNISSGANGSVSPSGPQQVGASGISVTATPSTGYKFKEWIVSGGAKVASTTAATTTVTATAQGTVTASFEEELYNITVTSNNAAYGDVNPKAPKAGIKTTAKIEATPYDGYEFVKWTAPSSITLENANNASTTITKATASGTVSATFQEIKYTITIKSSDANQGTVTPTSDQVGKHRAVTIKATPKTGYRFKNWTSTTGITITDANNATTTIKATQIGTVTAHFEVKPIDRYIIQFQLQLLVMRYQL